MLIIYIKLLLFHKLKRQLLLFFFQKSINLFHFEAVCSASLDYFIVKTNSSYKTPRFETDFFVHHYLFYISR